MRTRFCFSGALILYAFSCLGQTNTPADPVPHYFFMPPVQLWAPPSEQEQTPQLSLTGTTVPNPKVSTDRLTLNTGNDDLDFHSRVIRSGEFYLTQPEPNSENRFVRAAEAIWTPEVVKIGKTSVSCAIITAIKRKNPLCLLNPLFFHASW
jgi:hypothetical protein